MSEQPIIPCMPSPDGKTWKFWCPHCRVLHHHSAGDGHRVAHCHTDAGQAAFPDGYILALDPNGYLANLEKDATITWRDAIKIEPRLLQLYRQIRAVKDDLDLTHFCANAVWYGHNGHPGFKRHMCDLVGFQAESDDPRIRTMQAYSMVYDKLYGALPDCRNCGCL
jgi:hypothetical protein